MPVLMKEFSLSHDDAGRVFDLLKPTYTKDGRAAPEAMQFHIKLDAAALQLTPIPKPDDLYDYSFLPEANAA